MISDPVRILPPAFAALDAAVVAHDPETGTILDANEAAQSLYGFSVEELRERDVDDFTAPSTSFSQSEAERLIGAAADGRPQSFDWRIERANGELRRVDVHLERTMLDGHDVVLAEVRDVTPSQAREQRLRLLSRIVRHNLRNEMNVLEGHAKRLEDALADDTLMTDVEVILDIATDVGALSNSIRQIEEIATPDATERTRTELVDVVAAVVADLEGRYPNATIAVDAPEAAWVVADRGLQYAIEHAVDNAIRHCESDAPTVEVTVIDDPDRDRCVVEIVDECPPIPDVEIMVLDDDVSQTTTRHGSGAGLWVMQWCVDSLGGSLSIDPSPDDGNVVTITLPRVREPPRS